MNEEPKDNKSNNKGGYYIRPLSIKRQAVEEFEAGTTPVKEILSKYDIGHSTLWNWRRQVKKGHDPLIQAKRYPKEFRLRVVKEIITRQFTIKEAVAHFGMNKNTIEGWCAKYSCQISDLMEPMAKEKQANESIPQSDHVRQLERALEDANLKIIGLETMINIAEKDLKIDIRKKSGTKQSK